ncbi:alpha/beta hydrolase fold domain-containing protein [uncultured Paraglaciecola sp.]|uniref:alpha/beta hydrolase fold domain-containing protein n=1 Tax=uncultured Paraglaciecola sp. TaxID=1765024 RepID=UPI0030D7C684|tara:strand:- start:20964 stop:22067 length:1104 start_codon:yes stop_codon:yes gene_type:complete
MKQDIKVIVSDSQPNSNLPGRLGNPDLQLRNDPRAEPRLIEVLAAFGMDVQPEPAPVTAESTYQDCLAYFKEVEIGYEALYTPLHHGLPDLGNVRSTEIITGVDGNEIALYIHRPSKVEKDLPCVVHLHGGGMVFLKAADVNYVRWRDELSVNDMVVIGVEFRNGGGALGNHPYPAGLNDCASAIRWVHANKKELGVSHIVVSGESGGGNLSLAVALKAKKEGWLSEISGVYAMCPYISGMYANPPSDLVSMRENDGYTINLSMMGALAKAYDPEGENHENPLAWPYHAKLDVLDGLPPHTISVNELDPLRDEGLAYHHKLLAAGVSSVTRTVKGTCHGSDCVSPAVMPDVYAATVGDITKFTRSLV